MDGLKAHTADIGFLAYDLERAAEVDYSEGYALMYNTYVVRADSEIRKSADVDRAGVRVGAVKGQTQELYLSANLKNGHVRMFPTKPPQAELEKLLLDGEIDAFAANRQEIEQAASQSPKLRALPDNFLAVEQAIVIDKGNRSRLDPINGFLEDVRASGFVKASLERAKIAGVGVAPAKR
jgi:polar amino acid transport system substrate-binding protein